MSKNKKKITSALQDSIDTLNKALEKWDEIEEEKQKKRPYASPEERMLSENGELLRDLKNQLDNF